MKQAAVSLTCPRCEYDLRGSIKPEGVICPECGWKLTQQDIETLRHQPDGSGEPGSLSPHEARASGWVVMLGIIVPLVISVVIVFMVLTRIVL